MTLLQDRPLAEATEAPPAAAAAVRADTWLDTSDHKRLGLLFIYASLLFVVVGGVLGLIIGLRQAAPSLNLAAERWLRLYGMHTMVSVLLFLTALWVGLAVYLVPLQIGSGRLASPRAVATGFWLYLVGGGCFVASYIVGAVNGAGLAGSHPLAHVPGGVNTATNLWIVSLALIAIGFLLPAASLLTTVALLRTDGMTLFRVPAFSWATMVASAVTILATPVFLAGLLMLYLDQHFGGSLFDYPKTAGALSIWQHTLWLYGRPDVFLLTLVGLGAATDVVTTHARRPLLDHRAGLVLLGLFGALSLTTFAVDPSVGNAVIVPTYSIPTALVAAPLGLLVLLWMGTLAVGRPRFHAGLLFVVGAVLLWVFGAANAVAAAFRGVPGLHGDSAWIAGNVHAVVFGPPTLLGVGALYHWAPKLWGRRLGTASAGLVFLCLWLGFLLTGLAYYLLGYNGAPLYQLAGMSSYQKALYGLAEGGGALIVVGVIVLLLDLAATLAGRRRPPAGDDPYQGLTLEWATTSPPPRRSFTTVPEVRSAAPLLDLREAEAAADTSPAPSGAGASSTRTALPTRAGD